MRTLAVCATLCLFFTLATCRKKDKCKLKNGLKCGSWETLTSGSSFMVESKSCQKGRYPKNENCMWFFDVKGCTPTFHCDMIDIKGNGKNCRGDKLTVSTWNKEEVFCGKKKDVNFTPDEMVSFFDVEFTSNRRGEGKGFQCVLSCGEAPPTTTMEPATTVLSSECECGLPNRVKRIVGGIETEINEYPWQVGLAYTSIDRPFCGGAILSSTTIVTAAHCTVDFTVSDFEVIVGDHDVTIDDGQERFSVCNKVEHPSYNSDETDNDISVITLCSPMTFRKEVKPVCLPTQPGPAYDNVLATVSGWGTLQSGGFQPDQLMEVNVTTMTNTECNADYNGQILGSMICASDDGKDACQGDSGGPLITKESGNFFSLIGLVSWGVGCADPDYPGVYSRITENIDFIRNNLGGTSCKVPGPSTVPSVPTANPGTESSEPTSSIATTTLGSSDCKCGIANRAKRIVGGVQTEMNEYPWQVGLVSTTGSRPYCGGSILSSKTILTAAHCTEGDSVSNFDVVVGEHDWTVNDGQERFSVCAKKEHPSWDSSTNDFDFSILTLCNDIRFRKEASPVCLPNQSGPSYDDVTATVSGWGTLSSGGFQPNQLREVNVTTITNTACKAAYGNSIKDSMICATDNGKDACQGDSGGPLVTMEPGSYYSQIGVVSWGAGCADPSFPGVYSRVTAANNFIQNNMQGSTCPSP